MEEHEYRRVGRTPDGKYVRGYCHEHDEITHTNEFCIQGTASDCVVTDLWVRVLPCGAPLPQFFQKHMIVNARCSEPRDHGIITVDGEEYIHRKMFDGGDNGMDSKYCVVWHETEMRMIDWRYR